MQFYRLRSFGSTDATTFTICQDEGYNLWRKDGKVLAITRTCHHIPEDRNFNTKLQAKGPNNPTWLCRAKLIIAKAVFIHVYLRGQDFMVARRYPAVCSLSGSQGRSKVVLQRRLKGTSYYREILYPSLYTMQSCFFTIFLFIMFALNFFF